MANEKQDKVYIQFFHECKPPKATLQHGKATRGGGYYQTHTTKMAIATYRAIFERHAPKKPIEGPVSLSLAWTYPHTKKPAKSPHSVTMKPTRPDLDNLAKIAVDCMARCGYFADDAQVAHMDLAKYHGDIPGIYVEVYKL